MIILISAALLLYDEGGVTGRGLPSPRGGGRSLRLGRGESFSPGLPLNSLQAFTRLEPAPLRLAQPLASRFTPGPCRFQMAETTCQPQFEPPHHLEWLIRRLSASSIWGRMHFFAGRPVRSWRRALRFRRAPPGPLPRAFARGWVGSRYRAGKCMGGGLQLGSPRNPLRAGWLPSLPVVGRGDFPQPQKLRPHS